MDDTGMRAISLRDRLRADTRAAHEALDAAFAGLDLTDEHGLGTFLATQHAALATLRCAAGEGADAETDAETAGAMTAEMMAALEGDLAALGLAVPQPAMPMLSADPTAVLYILLGSRLGTQVMARHWQAAAHGRARDAGRYFTLDPRRQAWRDFVTRMGQVPGQGAQGDRLIADAGAIFDHYAATLAAVLQPRAAGS